MFGEVAGDQGLLPYFLSGEVSSKTVEIDPKNRCLLG